MIHVLASLQIKNGHLDEFLAIFKANRPSVLMEKGCIEYVPTIDVPAGLPPQELNDHGVTIVEKWETLDDLLAHLKTPHMVNYAARVKDLVEKRSIKVLREA